MYIVIDEHKKNYFTRVMGWNLLCEKIIFYFNEQTTFIMDLVCIQDIKLYNIYGKH